MKIRFATIASFLLLLLIAHPFLISDTNAQESSPALLRFDQESVDKAEFERVYQKNNGGYEAAKKHTAEQFREYLQLYINFKRKVFEAEAKGLQDSPSFKQEFETYRKQLAQPYLSAKEVEEQIIQEAYDRSKWLVNADHLLVRIPAEASPEDTLAAYQTILAYKDSLPKPEPKPMEGKKKKKKKKKRKKKSTEAAETPPTPSRSFSYMAENYSQDPSAKTNKGNLGYFSVFDMVYPFESAAFNTEPGQVSDPVRTQFGYHLVKVNEKIPSGGKKRVAHIIIRVGDRYSAKDSTQAEAKINELYQKLEQGEEFATLAKQHSDDPGSASKGGDLGMSRLLPEMENLKIKLGKGEYSKPFQTAYGYHILTVTEVEETPSFEDAQANLKQRIARDTRSKISRNALINRIKKENKFQIEQTTLDAFKAIVGPEFPRGSWKPEDTNADLFQQTLFTIGTDKKAIVQDLIDYYTSNRARNAGKSPAEAVEAVFKAYSEKELLAYEEARLPEKNPDFRHLVKEYRDGILLFTLMEDRVWKKAVEDTLGLKAYYESHQDSFWADVTIAAKEYRSTEESVMQQVVKLMGEGKSEQEIDSLINTSSSLQLRITSQNFEKGEETLPAEIFAKEAGYVSEIIQEDDYYRIVKIEESIPAGVKSFDKARPQAITLYQDFLEKKWLEELAEKYPVEIDENVFAKLFQ